MFVLSCLGDERKQRMRSFYLLLLLRPRSEQERLPVPFAANVDRQLPCSTTACVDKERMSQALECSHMNTHAGLIH
jgi:hypothetical protein